MRVRWRRTHLAVSVFVIVYTEQIQCSLEQWRLFLNLLDQHILLLSESAVLVQSLRPATVPLATLSPLSHFVQLWAMLLFFSLFFQSLFLVDSHSFSVEVTCKLIGMCRLCVCGTCARGLEFARVRVCVVPMEPPGLVHERTRGALNADTATVRCAVTLQTQAAPRISFLSTTGLPHPNLRLLSQDNADRKQKVFLLV